MFFGFYSHAASVLLHQQTAHSDDGVTQQASVVPPRRMFSSAPKLDEDARRRSEAATQQLMQNYNGPPNVGIRLMSKMGYGVAGMRLHCLIAAAAPFPSFTLSDCCIQIHTRSGCAPFQHSISKAGSGPYNCVQHNSNRRLHVV